MTERVPATEAPWRPAGELPGPTDARDAAGDDPEWRRPPPTPREQRVDVAIGLSLAVLVVVSLELYDSLGFAFEESPPRWEQWVWAWAATLPLCLRRRFPEAVLVLVTGAFIGLQARFVFEALVTSAALFVALFTVGSFGRDRRLALAVRVVAVVALLGWAGVAVGITAWQEAATGEERTGLLPPLTAYVVLTFLMNALFLGLAWALGDLAWRDARGRVQLAERNVALRAERAERERRAVQDERVRIARELHDVVAHHVSVMGVQAGAARTVLDRDPEAARAAIAAVEASSREATEEMRKLLGMLRGTAGPEAHAAGPEEPLPDLSRLGELADSASVGGLRVEVVEVGRARPLPPGVSLSLYRIAQEALTNTVRHASAARADVRLRWLDNAVELEVTDDGRAGSARAVDRGGTGSGHAGMGLVGMRERVDVHGGELETGHRPGGGYRVRARVPLRATGATAAPASELLASELEASELVGEAAPAGEPAGTEAVGQA